MTDANLLELRHLGDELRTAFAEERAAISALDHVKLGALAQRKQEIASRLSELREQLDVRAPFVRDLFMAIQVEARATAMLAAAATAAVRSLLGYEPVASYDRRARQQTSPPGRVLATY